ncbi:lipoyl synthase [Candidatus Zixiibacteriota bacterium]
MPIPVTNNDHPGRKPDWLKVRPPGSGEYAGLKRAIRDLGLHTVCEEADCPNLAECWGGGTATVMILGDICTRACRFCNVASGDPAGRIDHDEPAHVAALLAAQDLQYIVLTSVDRDDLPDGGAGQFARTVRAIREECPDLLIETLIPDFSGNHASLQILLAAQPHVISHNVETTERLTRSVRDVRASYAVSLRVLADLKELAPAVMQEKIWTKSGIMVGMGETIDEVVATMEDLRKVEVDFLTIGQYLQPTRKHHPVREYVAPAQFESYREIGQDLGFTYVASGPLVRSSYRAGEFFIANIIGMSTGNSDRMER